MEPALLEVCKAEVGISRRVMRLRVTLQLQVDVLFFMEDDVLLFA